MNELVSVIVPIYNVERYLDRCVESLVGQTYKNLEIILVDDGSPDNCGKICDEYAKEDSRIRVIHRENGGVSSARNTGLDNASGSFICFVDPDDVPHPRFIEILINNIGDAGIIICDYFVFSKDEELQFLSIDAVYPKTYTGRARLDFPDFYYVIWNKMIRADVIRTQRFQSGLTNGEDTLFAFCVLQNTEKVAYLRVPLYGYYQRDDGAVAKGNDVEKISAIVIVWDYIIETLENADCSKRALQEAKENRIECLLRLLYKQSVLGLDDINRTKKQLRQQIAHILFGMKTRMNLKAKIVAVFNILR